MPAPQLPSPFCIIPASRDQHASSCLENRPKAREERLRPQDYPVRHSYTKCFSFCYQPRCVVVSLPLECSSSSTFIEPNSLGFLHLHCNNPCPGCLARPTHELQLQLGRISLGRTLWSSNGLNTYTKVTRRHQQDRKNFCLECDYLSVY